MTRKELEELVTECREAFETETRLTGTGTRSILHTPADAKTIAAFEAEEGRTFPPSYREFLLLHNGWERYRAVFTLTGVSGRHTARVKTGVKKFLRLFETKWKLSARLPDAASIEEYEAKGKQTAKDIMAARLYLPEKLFFGSDLAVAVFFFNPSVCSRAGEMEVIHTDITWRIHGRFASFPDMLRAHLELTRKRIALLERNRAKRERGG
jgi:hypothetical protein